MLQRAARNAYSWWWASHIRTKQSKWLDQNLQDMEEKVEYILKIINEDGDSFRVRAEQYYRKRPEIVNFVEDCFRGYRALAERYDHLSRDLQSANRTIATVYPERVQMSLDEEDYEDFAREANSKPPTSLHLPLPDAPNPNRFEHVVQAAVKRKSKMPSRMMSKKGLIKMGSNENSSKVSKSSGLTKSEALEEIDTLQKHILGLQTEKEFVKISYENGLSKYWEIENMITEMQAKVSDLQDEFGVGKVIEDHDARTLMSSTALKSCQETLAKLQEKQKRYKEEANAEYKRVEEARKKFESLIAEAKQSMIKENQPENYEGKGELIRDGFHKDQNLENLVQEKAGNDEGKEEKSQSLKKFDQEKDKNVKEKLLEKQRMEILGHEKATDVEGKEGSIQEWVPESQNLKNFDKREAEDVEKRATVSEVAEKIDELVDKVISLETDVSCQTALVTRLRIETNELHEHLQNLEQDKEILANASNRKSNNIKDLEEEFKRVQSLNQKVNTQNDQLETSFEEANVNLDRLSQNLLTAKPDETSPDDDVLLNENMEESQKFLEVEGNPRKGSKETEDSIALDQSYSSNREKENIFNEGSMKKDLEKDVAEELLSEGRQHQELTKQMVNEEDEEIWRKMFSIGLEDREKMLIDEYTSTLRNYKDVKKKLMEMEKRNRASSFKSVVQMKILRNSNASKDAEIRSLNEKLKTFQTNKANEEEHLEESFERKQDKKEESCGEHIAKMTTDFEIEKSPDLVEEEHKQVEKEDGDKSEDQEVWGIEEKIRMDIDDLLEENIEFWLRFSSSYQQIKKFQDSFHDLLQEIDEVKEKKLLDQGTNKHRHSSPSEIRPLYRHLRDMQAELNFWLENNGVLRDDLQQRFSSLSSIQEEISEMTNENSKTDELTAALSNYQAAKFQGEVLNMKQENTKVSDELRVVVERVKRLQIDIQNTLWNLEKEMGDKKSWTSGTRVPVRSFIFGIKLKKHKPSFFACMSPALQRQYSDLTSVPPPAR